MIDTKVLSLMAQACTYWERKRGGFIRAQLHDNGVLIIVEHMDKGLHHVIPWADIENSRAPLPNFHSQIEALCERVRK